MVRGARWELGSGKWEASVGEGESEEGGEGGDEKGKARYSGQGDINRPRDGLDLVFEEIKARKDASGTGICDVVGNSPPSRPLPQSGT